MGGANEFKSQLDIDEVASDACVQPVYRVVLSDRKCLEAAQCADSAKLAVGFSLKKGDQVLAKEVLERGYTLRAVPTMTSQPVRDDVVRGELLAPTIELADQVLAAINKHTF